MTAIESLPKHALENDWLHSAAEPDFFGDVRSTLWNGFGDRLLLVFDRVGKLAGAYLYERDGGVYHTERAMTVETWLRDRNGAMDY